MGSCIGSFDVKAACSRFDLTAGLTYEIILAAIRYFLWMLREPRRRCMCELQQCI